MINKIFGLFIVFYSDILWAEDQISEQNLKEVLRNYPLPTPEQILKAGLAMQESAQAIMEQKNRGDCINQNSSNEEKSKKINLENKCVVCAIINGEDEKEYQLILGTIPAENNLSKESSLFSPNEISISYSGVNDQPFHGGLEGYRSIGSDVSGHTYGSQFSLTADYNWGNFTFEAGSDLYVLPYDYYQNGKVRHYNITDESGVKKVLQEADEHSYLRFGTKYYLGDHDKNSGYNFSTPYLKFGFGIEHDSDQGIGNFGGISHREKWHEMAGVKGNEYVNHFEDRTQITTNAKLGMENYRAIGSLGFCTLLEAGLSGSSSGNISTEAAFKASIDSGALGGFSRKDPLFVIHFESGISNPVLTGSVPKLQLDPKYSAYTNKNYSFIGDVKKTYTSLGAELGGKRLRFGVDVIYEKNQWNDGDLIYRTTLNVKF